LFVDGAVLELGLSEYVGRVASDHWRKVLGGEILAMSRPNIPMAPRSPSLVISDHAG
jgi:hypothetical protein